MSALTECLAMQDVWLASNLMKKLMDETQRQKSREWSMKKDGNEP
jgi:hypothetical protein